MIETAEAIQHAHMRGILHRDLKPANILIDRKGHPHITDFGLAKRIESDVELTASGAIMGTPAFMSPEQTAGQRGTITTATDVYGLGAILYAMLRVRPRSAVKADPDDRGRDDPSTGTAAKLNANVPRDLELICLKCLEKNPLDRYATAGALVDDLRRFEAGEPVSVRAAGPCRASREWARGSRRWPRRTPWVLTLYSAGWRCGRLAMECRGPGA